MDYKQKRNRAKLSLYTMAKQLGITEKKYKEVESKKRPLEGNLVDKFQETLNDAKQITLDRNIKMMEINRWFKSEEANETLNKYGYTQKDLATELELSRGTVSEAFKYGRGTDDVKEKIYDFLTNPINKKIAKEEKHGKIENLEKRLKALKISQKEFAKMIGRSQVITSYLITGSRNVSPETVQKAEEKIKELEKQNSVKNIEESVEVVEEVIEKPVEVVEEIKEAPMVEETTRELDYKALYEELTLQYSNLLSEKLKYQRQVMLYEKLIEKM